MSGWPQSSLLSAHNVEWMWFGSLWAPAFVQEDDWLKALLYFDRSSCLKEKTSKVILAASYRSQILDVKSLAHDKCICILTWPLVSEGEHCRVGRFPKSAADRAGGSLHQSSPSSCPCWCFCRYSLFGSAAFLSFFPLIWNITLHWW